MWCIAEEVQEPKVYCGEHCKSKYESDSWALTVVLIIILMNKMPISVDVRLFPVVMGICVLLSDRLTYKYRCSC